jgi:hypothetical protein
MASAGETAYGREAEDLNSRPSSLTVRQIGRTSEYKIEHSDNSCNRPLNNLSSCDLKLTNTGDDLKIGPPMNFRRIS